MGIQLAPDVGDHGFVFVGGVLHPYVTAARMHRKAPRSCCIVGALSSSRQVWVGWARRIAVKPRAMKPNWFPPRKGAPSASKLSGAAA